MTPTQKTTSDATPAVESPNSAGIILLQWLSYAFWGWLIIGLIWLLTIILINAIVGASVSSALPYAIAATVVVLPIAFVCDFFYRKHEPAKKTGAAMVVMIIHAVLFALLAIGTLITTVFLLINMSLDVSSDGRGVLVGTLTSGFATLLYAGALLRTINPKGTQRLPFVYGLAMLGVSMLLFIFAIVGPLVTSINTRGDRQIEAGLESVKQGVDSYIRVNNALPSSLSDIQVSDEAGKMLVTEKKVRYSADGVHQTLLKPDDATSYRYQLCVTYKAADSVGNRAYTTSYYEHGSDGYQTYLTLRGHDAGDVCYKLQYTAY